MEKAINYINSVLSLFNMVKEKILQFINENGPALPLQIAKLIGSDSLMASAHLSEMVANKRILVSKIKVGGSPLYFLPGQEAKLQSFSNHLGEKEQKVYEYLKQKKIVKDNELSPLFRVIMRDLKDFAIPLQVKYKDTTHIFWRWVILPGDDAKKLIESEFGEKQHPQKQQKKPDSFAKVQSKLPQKLPRQQPISPKRTSQRKLKGPAKAQPKPTQQPDPFLKKIINYFNDNNVHIIEKTDIRKGAEYEFVVELSSAVGALTYFCKAKNKKKINDGDVSSTFIRSQSKKLPPLFLTTGKLTKKAQELVEKEFQGMAVKKI